MRLTSKGFKLLLSSVLVAAVGLVFADALLMGTAAVFWIYLLYSYRDLKISLDRLDQVKISPTRVEGTLTVGASIEEPLNISYPLRHSLTLTPNLRWADLEPGSVARGDAITVFSFRPALSGLFQSETLKACLRDRHGLVEGSGEVNFTASFRVYPRVFSAALEALQYVFEGGSLFEETYTSRVSGRGVEYAESREYVPGDPLNLFDWKAMARTAKPYVKQYYAESGSGVRVVYDPMALDPFSLDQLNSSLLRLLLSITRTEAPIRLDVMDSYKGESSITLGHMNVLETAFKIALQGMIEEFKEYYTVIDPGRTRLYDTALKSLVKSKADTGTHIGTRFDDLVILSSLSRDPLIYIKYLQWRSGVHSVIQPCEPWVWAGSLQQSLDMYAEVNRKLRVIEKAGARIYLQVEHYLSDYIRGVTSRSSLMYSASR